MVVLLYFVFFLRRKNIEKILEFNAALRDTMSTQRENAATASVYSAEFLLAFQIPFSTKLEFSSVEAYLRPLIGQL